jgi:DNA-binding NtrC family response regulator
MSQEKILLIEADYFEQIAFVEAFPAKYEFVYKESVMDSLKHLPYIQPSVIIYDMGYPEEYNGVLQLKKICNDRIPIITIVSENSLEIERAVRTAGVFYYFVKPLQMKRVVETVDAAVKKSKAVRTQYTPRSEKIQRLFPKKRVPGALARVATVALAAGTVVNGMLP